MTATDAFDLTGNQLANRLWGNEGVNSLNCGGADVLAGFGGADIYQFTTALGAGTVDMIVGFEDVDTIALDDAVFAGLGLGTLSASAFVVGTSAQDDDDRIIYDPATGDLFFDADGLGGAPQVQFAAVTAGLAMTASDFVVV